MLILLNQFLSVESARYLGVVQDSKLEEIGSFTFLKSDSKCKVEAKTKINRIHSEGATLALITHWDLQNSINRPDVCERLMERALAIEKLENNQLNNNQNATYYLKINLDTEWQGVPITAVVLSCKKPVNVLYDLSFENESFTLLRREFSLEDTGSLEGSFIAGLASIALFIYARPIYQNIIASELTNSITNAMFANVIALNVSSWTFFFNVLAYSFNGMGVSILKVVSGLAAAFADACYVIASLKLGWGVLLVCERFELSMWSSAKSLIYLEIIVMTALMAIGGLNSSLYLFEGFTPTVSFLARLVLFITLIARVLCVALLINGAMSTYTRMNVNDIRAKSLFMPVIITSVTCLMTLPILTIIYHNREERRAVPTYPFDYVLVILINIICSATIIRIFDEANVTHVTKFNDASVKYNGAELGMTTLDVSERYDITTGPIYDEGEKIASVISDDVVGKSVILHQNETEILGML